MTQDSTIAETEQQLKQAERANLDAAADLYRDRLEELKAEDGADADTVDAEREDAEASDTDADADADCDDPAETALYAALTGESHTPTSPSGEEAALAKREQKAGALQERQEIAEERDLDATRQAVNKWVNQLADAGALNRVETPDPTEPDTFELV